ncbi:MAG: IS91 family transposase [Myxococcales bacterium]|nr:IS91 family transposase [Myxococcales bacterium]
MRRHGSAYLERFGASILPSHARALDAILHCRTPAMGGHVAVCAQCGAEHLLFHSCRHRACPQCGHDAAEAWVARQRKLLLPVTYFHVVFTLPAELRRLVRSHQTALVPVLFQAAFDSLACLCADPRFLGAQVGALAVLHTWTRTLEWHPHVHMLVPGIGLDADGVTIRTVPRHRKRFLVPVRALAKIFRARFLRLARRVVPSDELPQIPWGKPWVVFAKATVQGADKVLEYLGRYVHKTAIADHAITSIDDRSVTFRYRDSRTHERKAMTLPAQEFLRRFLQHVLPKGMHRVRAFGLLHPAHRGSLLQLQLALAQRPAPSSAPPTSLPRPRLRCPACNGSMRLLRPVTPEACAAIVAALGPATHRSRAPPLSAPGPAAQEAA